MEGRVTMTSSLRQPFCANPDCVLHVAAGDPGVEGNGEWATRPDGIVTSHGIYGGWVVCDLCRSREIGAARQARIGDVPYRG